MPSRPRRRWMAGGTTICPVVTVDGESRVYSLPGMDRWRGAGDDHRSSAFAAPAVTPYCETHRTMELRSLPHNRGSIWLTWRLLSAPVGVGQSDDCLALVTGFTATAGNDRSHLPDES
jgi:hypothetical protein